MRWETARRASAAAQTPQFVREAQRALHDLGYDPGDIDGAVGPKTRAALAKYQLTEKLTVTGELDAETSERLDVYKRLFRRCWYCCRLSELESVRVEAGDRAGR